MRPRNENEKVEDSLFNFYAPEGAQDRGVHPEDVDWPVEKVCQVRVVSKKAVYQIQFTDKSKQLVQLKYFLIFFVLIKNVFSWITHSMCNCSSKRKQFEKRGGEKLEELKVPIAPKRKRRSRRGGKRSAKARKIKKLALQPDILNDMDEKV